MKAVAYLRVSTEGQAEEGLGLDFQRAKIEELAREKGLKVAEYYVIEG